MHILKTFQMFLILFAILTFRALKERQVMRAWRDKVKDNQVSKVLPLMPRKFDCLRHVPFSERYLREREERVKDMVMAARVEKQKVHTTPDALLPQIPSLADLRPYPSHLGIEYKYVETVNSPPSLYKLLV